MCGNRQVRWCSPTRASSLASRGVSALSERARLKDPDHSFAQSLWIALSAFRDLNYGFGDEKGHSGRTVSQLQPFKRDFVRGSYRRDVLGIKRHFLYVQKPPNRHFSRPPSSTAPSFALPPEERERT